MRLGNPLHSSSDNEASTDNELSQQSISELVTILRSAFRSSVFDKVEEILIARERKLLKKIACKDRKLSLALMDKLQAEDDLKICLRNCDEIKNTLRIRDETCLDLQEELRKRDMLIYELNLKNLTLEAAKSRAESEVKALQEKVEDFNQMVMHLEKNFKEIEKLRHLHTHVKLEADEDTFSNLGRRHPIKGLRNSLPAETMHDVPNCNQGLTGNNHSDRKENALLSSEVGIGDRIMESTGIIVIGDTDEDDDDECGQRGTLGAHGRISQSVAANVGHPTIKLESIEQNTIGSLKRKWVAGESLRKSTLLTGDLDSDSEVSSSSSSDSDDDDDQERKKLRMRLNLDTCIPIFK